MEEHRADMGGMQLTACSAAAATQKSLKQVVREGIALSYCMSVIGAGVGAAGHLYLGTRRQLGQRQYVRHALVPAPGDWPAL